MENIALKNKIQDQLLPLLEEVQNDLRTSVDAIVAGENAFEKEQCLRIAVNASLSIGISTLGELLENNIEDII